ncbi:uncharacterized protein MONBRDRAFT_25253 [Monosiga brevicollis MX1]|uniref:Translation initiation factor 3 N-terminal domain-containing protein n=1 Tax=Monosiga brevicollis TaxID=81824 RepID=A9UYV2_MONBE|nr:uncharacterized protein MONBRDRAFT_25253 [Monosiga brevicollis MX1]EDQ89672.1 predicted protein [Monosiga brevicollis MX1]|eukprot:XP_001745701.1 hypothetical protein [Monosiga brevicollis MX1]
MWKLAAGPAQRAASAWSCLSAGRTLVLSVAGTRVTARASVSLGNTWTSNVMGRALHTLRPLAAKKVKFEVEDSSKKNMLPNTFLLIGVDGEQLGEFTAPRAISHARQNSLSVVLVSQKPPVCRLMTTTHLRERQQKAREAASNKNNAKRPASKFPQKEIQMTAWITEHDLSIKLKQIRKFLTKGNQVRLFIKHRKGQARDKEQQAQVIARIQDEMNEIAALEEAPKSTGGYGTGMIATLLPNLEAIEALRTAANDNDDSEEDDHDTNTLDSK